MRDSLPPRKAGDAFGHQGSGRDRVRIHSLTSAHERRAASLKERGRVKGSGAEDCCGGVVTGDRDCALGRACRTARAERGSSCVQFGLFSSRLREVRTRFPSMLREGRLGCRDISSPTSGRMVRSGHDHQGLNQITRLRPRWRGAMPLVELACGRVRALTLPRLRCRADSGSRRRAGRSTPA
jgi:hypothetical protein